LKGNYATIIKDVALTNIEEDDKEQSSGKIIRKSQVYAFCFRENNWDNKSLRKSTRKVYNGLLECFFSCGSFATK
jgi:hypothetical protein